MEAFSLLLELSFLRSCENGSYNLVVMMHNPYMPLSMTASNISFLLKDCGVLSNPVGGLVDLSDGTTFGSVATYRCTDRNYKVTGGDTRFCGVSGTWSGSDPVCLPKSESR